MTKPTITAIGMCYNEMFYAPMFLESAKSYADEIVIVDGFSNDGTWEYLQEEAKKDSRIKLFQHQGNNPKTIHFGASRQTGYDNATSDWIFWQDFDEALEDGAKEMLINTIVSDKVSNVYNVRYEHFIENFGKVDASEPVHQGLHRFHKRLPDVRLDSNITHALAMSPSFIEPCFIVHPIIWHCGYINGMQKIYERYRRNMKKSHIHTPLQQVFWKEWHYFGNYPTKPIREVMMFNNNPVAIPNAIRERFHIGAFQEVLNNRDPKK